MKYILFDKSAVELLAISTEFQSTDYAQGKELINILTGTAAEKILIENLVIKKDNQGIYFIGKDKADEILVIDLTTCSLLEVEKKHKENILVVMQKMFRAALHFWNRHPFTNAERVSNSKLIIFPFPYNYNATAANKRLVLEREPKSKRLVKRGIKSPLLAYKYNDESMQYGGEESVNVNILDDAGESYLKIRITVKEFNANHSKEHTLSSDSKLFENIAIGSTVGNEGFRYLSYNVQYNMLTERQKSVVNFKSINVPLRIIGSAGTGKTTSMLLRAYKLLKDAKERNEDFNVLFLSHSESTRYELEEAFKNIDIERQYLSLDGHQKIEFITLFSFCKRFRNIRDVQVFDSDASDAKEYQLMLIEDIYKKIYKEYYKLYKYSLSEGLVQVFEQTDSYIIASMLQHEFSIQIKGRADGSFEDYKKLDPLRSALPVSCEEQFKDKDYIYKIYQVYQNQLEKESVYDLDDIVIEALLGLNAPIWRRERAKKGYDYLFVDEMHLFNLNEQQIFHFLTKDINQNKIPICFALDYSQAIGDRGDLADNYIEKELSNDGNYEYNTVMRSSPQIVNLCASIIASGVIIFQSNFKNPYTSTPQYGFSYSEEQKTDVPKLIMCSDEQIMFKQLRKECDAVLRELTCKNYKIAIISFDEKYVTFDFAKQLEEILSRKIFLLNGRNVGGIGSEVKHNDAIVFTSPYNINGLEFDAVILLAVDGKRVPQTEGVADIAKNYLRYRAYNMLYLACSRAKYRVIMLGNEQNGESECLRYSINARTLTVMRLNNGILQGE